MEAGNPLSNLYPSHTRHWWPLVEDILRAEEVEGLRQRIFNTLERDGEFEALSIDGTLKLCMTLQGQATYRASAQIRNSACFGDEAALRRILTIRGRTSAVLAMQAVGCEDAATVREVFESCFSPRALMQIKYVSTDSPSSKLYAELKKVCPNLECLSLDPVHLAIVYAYAQWGKRSAGSKVLRQVLNRVNQTDESLGSTPWGPFFHGTSPPSLSGEEERMRASILSHSLGVARSRAILDNVDPSAPMRCRITFIEALAAISKLFSHEVARKVTGTSKEVKRVLWSACAPDRLEWLFNGARARHGLDSRSRALLPSGTASNEALHSQVNSWTKNIRSLHQSTLKLKLDVMHFGKLLTHHVASCYPCVRQTTESVLLARSLSKDIWSPASWSGFCSTSKATLPLHVARVKEAKEVQAWTAKRPAANKVRKSNRKRTVTTIKRQHSVITAGIRPKDAKG